jgi:hypothetical protein
MWIAFLVRIDYLTRRIITISVKHFAYLADFAAATVCCLTMTVMIIEYLNQKTVAVVCHL